MFLHFQFLFLHSLYYILFIFFLNVGDCTGDHLIESYFRIISAVWERFNLI